MSKKTIFTIALQVVIIGAFVLIAAGSGTDGYTASTYSRPSYSSSSSSSSSSSTPKSICERDGYKYIGNYGSSSDTCHKACRERGYKKSCRPSNPPSSKCYCM